MEHLRTYGDKRITRRGNIEPKGRPEPSNPLSDLEVHQGRYCSNTFDNYAIYYLWFSRFICVKRSEVTTGK